MKISNKKFKSIIKEELLEMVDEGQIDEAWYDQIGQFAKSVAGDAAAAATGVGNKVGGYAKQKYGNAEQDSLKADIERTLRSSKEKLKNLRKQFAPTMAAARAIKDDPDAAAIIAQVRAESKRLLSIIRPKPTTIETQAERAKIDAEMVRNPGLLDTSIELPPGLQPLKNVAIIKKPQGGQSTAAPPTAAPPTVAPPPSTGTTNVTGAAKLKADQEILAKKQAQARAKAPANARAKKRSIVQLAKDAKKRNREEQEEAIIREKEVSYKQLYESWKRAIKG